MNKKILALLTVLLLVVSGGTVSAKAEESARVYVTISDGELQMVVREVTVTDLDGDGSLTINDTLTAAHNLEFEGGAEAGYASEEGSYGLYVTKLWGIENGGSYGYYVNNASAWSLVDPVTDGDYVAAFVYEDTVGFSDMYCFFENLKENAEENGTLKVKLSGAGYDENWAPVVVPVEGAVITVNGEATEAVTDANGEAEVDLTGISGLVILSAESDTQILVPTACLVHVAEAEDSDVTEDAAEEDADVTEDAAEEDAEETDAVPKTGVSSVSGIALAVAAAALAGVAVIRRKRRVIE